MSEANNTEVASTSATETPTTEAPTAVPMVEAPPARTFTQEDVDRIVQTQKTKAKASSRKEYDAQLERHGFKGGLEGFEESQRVAREQETSRLEETNQYKELYERTKSDSDRALAESKAANDKMRSDYQQEKLNNRIASAAKGAVDPSQVAILIKNRVKTDPEGNAYIVDDLGSRMTDQQGNFLSVESYVDLFLSENPHFKKAAPGRGTGQTGKGNNPAPSFGSDVDMSNPAYVKENKQQLIDDIMSGKIT